MNNLTITITSTNVSERKGVSQKTGKPWTMREQEATAECERFRQPMRLTLGDSQAAYAPGVYTLDVARSVNVSRYGELEFVREPVLLRVADLPRSKAA